MLLISDENSLRERAALFRYLTKNKKSLVHTFITSYGVANGKNKSIVHSEVTIDDLFSPTTWTQIRMKSSPYLVSAGR